jgi:AcrR family transcriptional regulator
MADHVEPNARAGMSKAVLRVLRGEDLAAVAKSAKLAPAALSEACDKFVDAGTRAVTLETPKGLDRRQEIIWVAIRLFSERGFRSTRLEDISEALGMTRPALYYYYKNKDELLVAVAQEAVQGQHPHDFNKPLPADAEPAAELAARVEDRVTHLLSSGLALYRMLLQERHELPPAASEILTENELREVRSIAALIKLGADQGVFADFQPTMVASTILALIAGTARWFDPARSSAAEVARLVSHMVLRGVLASSGAPRVAKALAGKKRLSGK